MKQFYAGLLLCMVIFVPATQAQEPNLVPNPGFETVICPVAYNTTVQPGKLSQAIPDWYNTNAASPDLFTNCGNTNLPNATMVPTIIFGYQYAQEGSNFMGFGFYGSWYEYIGVKLTAPLEAGETYTVSFYVACADAMRWSCNKVGAYLSTDQIVYNTTTRLPAYSAPHPFTPQVVSNHFLTDTTWEKIEGTMVAAGGEQYLTIGYFNTVSTTSGDFQMFAVRANPTYPNTTGTTTSPRSYYYIDNVSVSKQAALPIKLTSFTARVREQKVVLDWKTGSESNNCRFEVERSTNGTQFQKIGTIAGAINSDVVRTYSFTDAQPANGKSYYRIKQVDCDGRNSYSRIVAVDYAVAGFSIYPNPVGDQLFIDRNTRGAAEAMILDIAGKELSRHRLLNTREPVPVTNLLPGMYFVKVITGTHTYSQSFIKR